MDGREPPLPTRSVPRWDAVHDVVVAGYGYSGGMAAIAAADLGAEVGVYEKSTQPGGNSILSGGSCVYGLDKDATLAYLQATCDGTTDPDVLDTFAQGMVDLPDIVGPLAQAVGFDVVDAPRGGAYPFPGEDQLRDLRITRNERYSGFEWVTGARAGATLFYVVDENVRRRDPINVHYSAPVSRLITDDGEVVGCEVDGVGYVTARRAVILCTGGFEHDTRMIRDHVGGLPLKSVSPLGNTGDGIRMAQKIGAAVWHMWHVHGGYGYHLPDMPVAIRHSVTGPRTRDRPMPWIVVDRHGRRFMNEYPPAPQDTPIRDLLRYDADRQEYPYVPAYLLFDEVGRQMGPIGRPAMNDPSLTYQWSPDNGEEIARGYISRSHSIPELAEQIGAETGVLVETVHEWNAGCRDGRDPRYARPGWSMVPVTQPPFYSIPVYPIITNTQGGLRHDPDQRVLDALGERIPRLYKAGENGSVFGFLYLLGGNNTECFVGGRIAGQAAALEPPRSL